MSADYKEENIRTLDWKEHIRTRPGMYIGKLGDGQAADDGIYILIKEVIDNSMDEYFMGHGKEIRVSINENQVTVRDFGRGIPLGKVIDCVARINTGGKYDSKAFKKSVGLNGVGTKAVNALSDSFTVWSVRDGKLKKADFSKGELVKDYKIISSTDKEGTGITFMPDGDIFTNFTYREEIVEAMMWNYAYLNSGLKINFNGKTFVSKNGLADMLEKKTAQDDIVYPLIHLKGEDIEVVITHGTHYGEQYYSFVNGQNTTQGGTHLNAFKESIVKVLRDFYKKDYDAKDIRASIIAAVSIRVEEPIFESQTKTKLGSTLMGPDAPSIRSFVNEFLSRELDNFLHRNPDTAGALHKKILRSERERKEIADIKKEANKKAKKANIHNKKLRDCRLHYNEKGDAALRAQSTLFITEGDSASGSITKARNPQSQAVFSLRGKPLNCYGMTKKVVYQNDEFNLLQHALNIEDGLDDLRYNKVVIATDADVDGMHIRLL
ncbi:MAG TPA: toprim domain-containing protein, partial [Saprospiraceae bacterium]|nr:toprim domain-containing protein [Saprospiraceae bacterium]